MLRSRPLRLLAPLLMVAVVLALAALLASTGLLQQRAAPPAELRLPTTVTTVLR